MMQIILKNKKNTSYHTSITNIQYTIFKYFYLIHKDKKNKLYNKIILFCITKKSTYPIF